MRLFKILACSFAISLFTGSVWACGGHSSGGCSNGSCHSGGCGSGGCGNGSCHSGGCGSGGCGNGSCHSGGCGSGGCSNGGCQSGCQSGGCSMSNDYSFGMVNGGSNVNFQAPLPGPTPFSAPLPAVGTHQLELPPAPPAPKMDKLHINYNGKVDSVQMVLIKSTTGNLSYAPVVNGYIPQIIDNECYYDLKIPFAGYENTYQKVGYLTYTHGTDKMVSSFAESRNKTDLTTQVTSK